MKHLTAIFIFLVLSQNILARNNPFFNRLTVKDGLSSNKTLAVWQDKKGYIWIGTSNGLQRYDGKNFLYFGILKPEKLPAMPVRQITEDKLGNMWINYGGKYGIYNPTTQHFQEAPFENDESRYKEEFLYQDSKGNLFIILVRQKALIFDPVKGIITDNGLPFKVPDGYHINRIFEDSKTGFYWIACEEGVVAYDPKISQVYSKDSNPLKLPFLEKEELRIVTSFHIDKNRVHRLSYWTPQEQLFSSFDENSGRYVDIIPSISHTNQGYKELRHFFESKKDELWMYGVNGLYKYDRIKNRFDLLRFEFFEYGEIFQAYEDGEGALWLASDEGLYHYNHKSPEIDHYFAPKRDLPYTFQGIAEINIPGSTQKQYWMADWGTGLHILNQNLKAQSSTKIYSVDTRRMETKQTWSIMQDKLTQKVWVGNQTGWL